MGNVKNVSIISKITSQGDIHVNITCFFFHRTYDSTIESSSVSAVFHADLCLSLFLFRKREDKRGVTLNANSRVTTAVASERGVRENER